MERSDLYSFSVKKEKALVNLRSLPTSRAFCRESLWSVPVINSLALPYAR